MSQNWKILNKKAVFNGYFQVYKYRLQHTRYDGGLTPAFDREVFERGHAVVVIPYDHALDSTLLIEQFRPGVLGSNESPWLTEFIAGIIDPGETEETVAHREAAEEANCTLKNLYHITRYFVSPGCMTETMSLYLAEADLSQAGGVFGLEEEAENIRATVVSLQEAFARLERGDINNAMALIGLQWLQLNYQTLRNSTDVFFPHV
ncbi:MAG: NUDIX domain-containing protein [Gammaproteobacteria bacterium]|nr:NUDIX domain-containing protein [Gammaproteobacteria bacterium]